MKYDHVLILANLPNSEFLILNWNGIPAESLREAVTNSLKSWQNDDQNVKDLIGDCGGWFTMYEVYANAFNDDFKYWLRLNNVHDLHIQVIDTKDISSDWCSEVNLLGD